MLLGDADRLRGMAGCQSEPPVAQRDGSGERRGELDRQIRIHRQALAIALGAAAKEGLDDAAGAASRLPVPYSSNWALRQQQNLHIPQLVTPHGRTLSNHAAERVAGSGPGRPPTTLNALDYILENANKVKYDVARDAIQVRATQLPGESFVVFSGSNPNHMVTVMIPRAFDIP